MTTPSLGFGLGLRARHLPHIFEHTPAVDWFEVISENYMDTGGKPLRNIARIRERYPVALHGVSLSIGTVDPLDSEYLQKLKKLIAYVDPAWISDHLCWTGVAHTQTHDLLPVPYTEEALKHVVQRLREVQDYLERPIAMENPSTYLEFKSSAMPEAEFIARMAEESGCPLLLDVNNVYVTCFNHRLDAKAYIDALPLDRVAQIHLSGHSNKGTHIIDTHDDHVVDEVWALYRYAVHKAGRVPNTMIEWDENIPEFEVLYGELAKARECAAAATAYAPLPDLARPQPPCILNFAPAIAREQARLQEAILSGADSAPEEWIKAKEQFTPAAQLGVYADAYRLRLYDVVAVDYPVLKAYLGDASFDRLIKAYIGGVASRHFNVARYTEGFPEFLEGYAQADAFARELCALETAVARLADAGETAPLTPEHLAGMTPERLMESRLYPRLALKLFAFDYPANEYFRAVKEEQSPAPPPPEKSYLAVFRHEDTVWRLALEREEHALLSALFEGATVGEALERLGEDEAMAERLSEWFSRWMRNGLLAAREEETSPAGKQAA